MGESAQVDPRRTLSTFRYSLLAQSIGLLISLCCATFVIYAHYKAIMPWGSDYALAISDLIVVPMLAAIILVLVGLFLLAVGNVRKVAINLILGCFVFFFTCILGMRAGMHIRHNAFADLAHRSVPLIQAIKDYQGDHGSPPAQLIDLVPQYLSEVPDTGMGAYPEYIYETPNSPVPQWSRYTNEPWVLWLSTPTGVMDFDIFIYLPSQNYDAWIVGFGDDNVLARIGDWAYINE